MSLSAVANRFEQRCQARVADVIVLQKRVPVALHEFAANPQRNVDDTVNLTIDRLSTCF